MRVLLDEQLPRDLARELPGHVVRSVGQEGWAGLTNGELLAQAASGDFDVLVTADRNLEFQQNLTGSPLGVIVLEAPSTDIEDLRPLIANMLGGIALVKPGEVIHVAT